MINEILSRRNIDVQGRWSLTLVNNVRSNTKSITTMTFKIIFFFKGIELAIGVCNGGYIIHVVLR